MLYRLPLLIVLLLVGPASHLRAAPRPEVARIIVQERGAVSYGSGTLVDCREKYGLVVTNWHVVRDATGKIEVVFPDGFRSEARALKLDEDWDLAALVIWKPRAAPAVIASQPPRPGDRLTICGYGQGEYREATGRCTDFYAPEVGMPRELVELSVEARQGDSGGPILNDRGELAGVLFGAGQGVTLGSFGPRVTDFLASLAPDIGKRNQSLFPSTPALIAHAPPPLEEFEASPDWQSLQSPRELTSDTASSEPCSQCEPPAATGAVVASNEISSEKRTDSFGPWKPVDGFDEPETKPAVASIAGPAAGGGITPDWFEPLKNALAVVGVVFLFVQLVKAVS